jgi:hypothetical protein
VTVQIDFQGNHEVPRLQVAAKKPQTATADDTQRAGHARARYSLGVAQEAHAHIEEALGVGAVLSVTMQDAPGASSRMVGTAYLSDGSRLALNVRGE